MADHFNTSTATLGLIGIYLARVQLEYLLGQFQIYTDEGQLSFFTWFLLFLNLVYFRAHSFLATNSKGICLRGRNNCFIKSSYTIRPKQI